jgi:hypothetical protein
MAIILMEIDGDGDDDVCTSVLMGKRISRERRG